MEWGPTSSIPLLRSIEPPSFSVAEGRLRTAVTHTSVTHVPAVLRRDGVIPSNNRLEHRSKGKRTHSWLTGMSREERPEWPVTATRGCSGHREGRRGGGLITASVTQAIGHGHRTLRVLRSTCFLAHSGKLLSSDPHWPFKRRPLSHAEPPPPPLCNRPRTHLGTSREGMWLCWVRSRGTAKGTQASLAFIRFVSSSEKYK